MSEKEFKSLDEQIKILISRGLQIGNEDAAKHFLKYNNYYRVSGYTLTMRKNDVFDPSATLENVMEVYGFDWELRHILAKYLEFIEVRFKAAYAHQFSKLHGGLGYLNPALFTSSERHNKIIEKAKENRDRRKSQELYIQHFDSRHEEIPIWAFVDLFTIAEISKLYQITDKTIQKSIASEFNLNFSDAAKKLENFMYAMTIVRNLCAHGSRLYNRLFASKPSLNKREKALLRCDNKGHADNEHLFGYILNMRRLLTAEMFISMVAEIESLTSRYPFVNMKYYGFPDDWKTKVLNLK